MKKRDDLDTFYSYIMSSLITAEEKENFPRYFYNSFLAGENIVYHKSIAEIKKFNDDWITTLETYFPSIDKIIGNPFSTLRQEEEIVPIEKARKVNSASIKHLAANTHLIKEVVDGEVIPKKILTSHSEIEYGIYENRFIMTLINRLITFLSNRYEVVKSNIESYERKHLNLKSKFNIFESEVAMDIDLVFKESVDNEEVKEKSKIYLSRVTNLTRMVAGYKNSPFMKMMDGQKPVKPPIMKTNIILKNPDFRNAYNLWLFLDHCDSIFYDIDVEERDLDVAPAYMYNLNQIALITYALVLYNQKLSKKNYDASNLIKYERKATKLVKTHAKDVVENPSAIVIEDNTINEYYLEQNKRVFKQKLEELLGEDIPYEEALKKALTQTIGITNSLFQSVFDMAQEEDLMEAVEKKNLIDKLVDAKKKARIAQIIRETKEADYKESVNLEKNQLKEISRINTRIIKESQKIRRQLQDKAKKKRLAKQLEATRQDRDAAKEKRKELTENLRAVKDQVESEIVKEEKKINEQLLKQAEKELIAAEKARARAERKEVMRRLREERKKALEAERRRFQEHRALIREKFKEMRDKIVAFEKKRREQEILQLREKYRQIREQEFNRIRSVYSQTAQST
jgi:exonuclease SbcC